jgi:NADH-quinone oxidoreductase subunit L
MTMLQHALLVLLLPLASAAVIALFLRRSGGIASILSTATAAAIAGFALLLALNNDRFSASFEWLRLGNFALSIGFKFDDLAALMLVIVGIVGLCAATIAGSTGRTAWTPVVSCAVRAQIAVIA